MKYSSDITKSVTNLAKDIAIYSFDKKKNNLQNEIVQCTKVVWGSRFIKL